jgi:ribosome maturation factor RimP
MRRNEWAKAHFSFGPTFIEIDWDRRIIRGFPPKNRTIGKRDHRESGTMGLSLEQIRRLADRVAASHRLEVVEVEFSGGGKQRVLRIFIEKDRGERARLAAEAEAGQQQMRPDHGGAALDQLAWVTHEDCERFSGDFGTVLDVENLGPSTEFTLEVSSPGLDRKLITRFDYERFVGSLVKVRSFTPVAGSLHWSGRLVAVKVAEIVLDPAALRRGGKKRVAAEPAVEIPFSNIEKANLVPEF